MPKDPAFLFYPGDYLRDTQMLSEKAQVAYDRIMCEHMRNICISQQQLNFITKWLNEAEKSEILTILLKVDGGYEIEWVAESIRKRRTYSESRRENRKGKSKKDMINISKSYDSHMEIANVNENKIENKLEGGMGGGFVWDDEKRKFFEDGPWQMKFCTAKRLHKEEIDEWMRKFLEDIELRNEYKPKKELQSHFTNWFNKQKITKKPKNGTYQLLEELRLEHEAATRNQAGGNGNQYESGTTHW